MAESARDVDLAVSGAETKPRGVVRLTAPPGIAFDLIAPCAALARKELPEIQLEVISTVSYLDLARREADLGVRIAPLDRASTQRDLVTLASVEHGVAAYATPGYIGGLPRGYVVADVGWIAWAPPLEHIPPNPQRAAAPLQDVTSHCGGGSTRRTLCLGATPRETSCQVPGPSRPRCSHGARGLSRGR